MSDTPQRPRVTIEEVADAAGVSVATVSRALRDLPNVATKTKDRVVDVAESLGYRADPAASRLATGRTNTVAVAVPTLNSWYFSQVVGGAEAALSERGYDMIVVSLSGDDARRRFLREATSMHRRADGLVLVDMRVPEDEAAALAATQIHVVSVGFQCESISSVMLDDVAIGTIATEHLIDLGHRRIALIQGVASDKEGFAVSLRRKQGYTQALQAAGVELDEGLVENGGFCIEGGEAAMTRLMNAASPPTAVFAMSDEMAMGAIKAARDAGLEIPADVSVIGVDDHELAHVLELTTIHQDVANSGATAARWIMDDLANDDCIVYRSILETELVVRGTTGPVSIPSEVQGLGPGPRRARA
jgi:LacI family repressor for deo operon, udp, cdd, tsx, nupC, and nupG